MQRWEYYGFAASSPLRSGVVEIRDTRGEVFEVNTKPHGWQDLVNKLGAEGWEMVGVRQEEYYFKRPID